MFAAFDIPFNTHMVGLYDGTMKTDLAHLAPARLVPVMQTPDGVVVQDTIAMAETLAENHPGLWPDDPAQRALARGMVAEMHSGFGALRGDCAMNLEHAWTGFAPSDAVSADVARIDTLWSMALDMSGSDGWLFGEYSLADVFYAPVAARVAGHGLSMSDRSLAYVKRQLNHDLFRQWRAMGLTKTVTPKPYRLPLSESVWPGPAPIAAVAVDTGPSVNDICPYSGKPVTHFLDVDGTVYGFCNAFCRDKTMHDPAAWPKFMEIYQS